MSLSAVLAKQMAIIWGSLGSELSPALATPNWTLGTGWTYGTAPARIQKLADGTGTASPASETIVPGNTYKVEISVGLISGSTATWSLGGVSGGVIDKVGKITKFIVASTSDDFMIEPVATGLRLSIDEVSVKECTFQTIGMATDFDFEANKETIDITTLDDDGWKQFMVDLKEFKVSFSGLFTRGSESGKISYNDLLNSLVGYDTKVIVGIKPKTGNDQYFIGEGYLISCKNSGGTGDKITYSGEIQGAGPLSLINV